MNIHNDLFLPNYRMNVNKHDEKRIHIDLLIEQKLKKLDELGSFLPFPLWLEQKLGYEPIVVRYIKKWEATVS